DALSRRRSMPSAVALMTNSSRAVALECEAELAGWLLDRGAAVRLQRELAALVPRAADAADDEALSSVDLLVAVGGDGTLLAAGRTCIATYAAYGIIVATPTGPTAYNLAAGGPLVHPAVQVILLTPICPHTLNVRSLIIGDRETIDVVVQTDPRDTPLLTVDGQIGFELRPNDRIRFSRAEFTTRLV